MSAADTFATFLARMRASTAFAAHLAHVPDRELVTLLRGAALNRFSPYSPTRDIIEEAVHRLQRRVTTEEPPR